MAQMMAYMQEDYLNRYSLNTYPKNKSVPPYFFMINSFDYSQYYYS